MTLNGVIIFVLLISPNSIALQAYYVTVVEDRLILSAEYRLPLLAQSDPPCSAVSAIAEPLVFKPLLLILMVCLNRFKDLCIDDSISSLAEVCL